MSTKLITPADPPSRSYPHSFEFTLRHGDGVETEITAEISYRHLPHDPADWEVTNINCVVAYASAQGCPVDWMEDRKGWLRTAQEWAEADAERIVGAIERRRERDEQDAREEEAERMAAR